MMGDQLSAKEQELDLLLSILNEVAQDMHEMNEDLEAQLNTR